MTFRSEDVAREVAKYTYAERCKILAELQEKPSDDEDLEEFFDYENPAMQLAHDFVNLGTELSDEDKETIDVQFGHYILLLNGWHL
jgi:hypothetical protein